MIDNTTVTQISNVYKDIYKLAPKSGDTIVMTLSTEFYSKMHHDTFINQLGKLNFGDNVTVIVLPPNCKLETFSIQAMKKAGWVRDEFFDPEM